MGALPWPLLLEIIKEMRFRWPRNFHNTRLFLKLNWLQWLGLLITLQRWIGTTFTGLWMQQLWLRRLYQRRTLKVGLLNTHCCKLELFLLGTLFGMPELAMPLQMLLLSLSLETIVIFLLMLRILSLLKLWPSLRWTSRKFLCNFRRFKGPFVLYAISYLSKKQTTQRTDPQKFRASSFFVSSLFIAVPFVSLWRWTGARFWLKKMAGILFFGPQMLNSSFKT